MDDDYIVKDANFMKTILKKPTILQLGIGLLVSICRSLINGEKTGVLPRVVGKYRLVSPVQKENLFREYHIGVYKYRNKKVFIKTWIGFVKDFQYYELINEYFINKALYKKLNSHAYIKVPNIISYVSKMRSFSIIYEFIDGESLSSFSRKKQIKIISEVLNVFDRLFTSLTEKESRYFSKRTLKFYIPSLAFLSILTILSSPRSFKVVLRGYMDFLNSIKCIERNNLTIAHRDLSLHNILVKGRYVFLIDCARVVLTYKDYDIAYMRINPTYKKIVKELSRNFNYSINAFLENYILINQARSFSDPVGFKNFYLEELWRRYG